MEGLTQVRHALAAGSRLPIDSHRDIQSTISLHTPHSHFRHFAPTRLTHYVLSLPAQPICDAGTPYVGRTSRTMQLSGTH
jgi:hypothetical protein